jgi:MFS family permease
MTDTIYQKTRRTLLWSGLLAEPLVSLFGLLPFIMRKDLGASLFELSLLSTLRPVVAVFTFYWASGLTRNKQKLLSNTISARIGACAPFLLLPWISTSWSIIIAAVFYLFFYRAQTPAWMEILNRNLPKEHREKTFSLSSALNFSAGVILALLFGKLLDQQEGSWKWLLCSAALLAFVGALLPFKLPIRGDSDTDSVQPATVKDRLFKPWKDCFQLLRTHALFAKFQWGFMIGGFGLMLMAPALTIYFVDLLALSHTEMTIGRLVCMGFGFALFTSLWAKAIRRFSLHRLTAVICCGFGLFPIALLLAQWDITLFYFAFVLYGCTQAGSHLIWHLSGPLFAEKQDSAPFSKVNILMVGLRGLVAPLLGWQLCQAVGPLPVLVCGSIICLLGSLYMATVTIRPVPKAI